MTIHDPLTPATSSIPAEAAPPARNGGGDQGFHLVSELPVPVLRLSLQHYRHSSGADHYHLACDDEHRAFVVSFRTIPHDSTGLPHILEHLVLCGSERYPVRDPFFMMLRRSLNTFMNAMTGGDSTYYPFASQVAKDFDNLLGIYLDAVFEPNLDRLDFHQEGHRLEPAEAADQDPGPGDWEFKGVVYNEMKGALGNTLYQLAEAMHAALLPDTPYRLNSGGDPRVIPMLSHADLVAFHTRHYCAANACFATYGSLDVAALHARFAPYLAAHPGRSVSLPAPQAPLHTPAVERVPVPLEAGQDPRDVSAAWLGWVWREPVDIQELLLGELLDHLLLGHAGAPMRHALESSGLGRALDWSGYHGSGHNSLFVTSLKGMDPAEAERFEPLVMDCLRRLADEGIDPSEIEAALHQLELARRTISGDRFPFGLELGMRATEAWRLGLDPVALLDIGPALETLRERVTAPGFWQGLIRERLLDNPHRVLLLADPDAGFNARQAEEERGRVDARVAALDRSARAALLDEARALAERQAQIDDPTILPDLALSDVPAEQRWADGRPVRDGLTVFETGTNGILHHVAAIPVGGLSLDELLLLPLLASTIGSLGVGTRDYLAQAVLINAVCGGISAWLDLRGDPTDSATVRGYLFLEVSGLARRHEEFTGLLAETLTGQRFDEHSRLREIFEQSLAGLQQQVNWSGHDLAEQAAARGFGGRAGLGHALTGLGRLAWLKDVDRRERAGAPAIAGLAARLAALLAALRERPVQLALIGDAAGSGEVQSAVLNAWDAWALPAAFDPALVRAPMPSAGSVQPTAFTTATQVNYCATAYPTAPLGHPDAPALAAASRYLTFNFLHPRLREQGGAYGGRSGYNGQTGTFGMISYRDPRLADTFADMRMATEWLTDIPDDPRLMREAILGVIGGLDRPGSPAGEGRRRFVADLVGYGPAVMNDFRRQVLAVSSEDLRRVAETWLAPERASQAVVTSESLVAASGLDWETVGI